MQLKSLSIRGLYRTLSLDVEFNEEITLLVGINGSGKTSVLNVIDWLLKPDFRQLARTQYDSLSLKFAENNTDYEITAKQRLGILSISIDGPTIPLKPITIKLGKFALDDGDETGEEYLGLTPEKHEIPLWELLKSFPKPTVISLDRTVSAESEEEVYSFSEMRMGMIRKRPVPLKSPITYVKDVTSSKYAEFRAKAIANDDELKASIVMSALQDPKIAFRGEAIKPMTQEDISKLEEKVSTYLSAAFRSPDVRKQVQRFFRESRLFTEQRNRPSGQEALVFDFMASRYRQIESLAKAFNDFETKNASAFKSLNDYLVSVNRFLGDSDKELFFDQSTGKLAFLSKVASDGKQLVKSVAYLSSGERQILVLFTFLAFASNPKNVFIVDEPELSLHPKWQAEFMDAFAKLRPEGTQLLLATHSPDIVGKYKASCFALRARES